MNSRPLLPVSALVLSGLVWCSSSLADDGIRINDVQIIENMSDTAASDIFGIRGGYVHPYLSLRGEYTDNLYNVDIDEKDNFLTVVTPGIWFATPRVSEVPIYINPSNTATGGLRIPIQEKESFDRFQAYLLANWDFENYSDNSDLNATNYHFEGMFQFNLRGGLSLRLIDRYGRNQDRFDINTYNIDDIIIHPDGNITLTNPGNVRRFKNNVGTATLNWDMTEKFTTRFDYSNFYLDYDDLENNYLNRTDNAFGVHLYYNYSPKTSLFIEYRYVDVDYDDVNTRDNSQNFYYGGLDWKATAKTSLMAKAGYQDKSYDMLPVTFIDNIILEGEDDTQSTFSFEVVGHWRATEKTALRLSLYKALEESDTLYSSGIDTTQVKLVYEQKIFSRFVGLMDFWYINEDYSQDTIVYDNIGIPLKNREDNRYYFKASLQYVFMDRLMAEASYSYDTRDSSRDLYDYSTNTIMFSLNTAL
jgi:hypothetical protein